MAANQRKRAIDLATHEEFANEEASAQAAFRLKSVPGPRSMDAQLDVEQELADAATIIKLVDRKELKVNKIKVSSARSRSNKRPARLSQNDEEKLAIRVQQLGDLDARNTLVMANLGLVHLVVGQFMSRNIRYDDLLQEGIMGLIRATETFEPERAIRFSTYAVYWIRAKIQRLLQKLERDDNPAIVGAEYTIGTDGRKKRPKARKISMENSSSSAGDDRSLNDILPSPANSPEEVAMDLEREHTIREILLEIADDLHDPRIKVLVEHRILTEEPITLAEIGTEVGLSREGVRLIESKLLRIAKTKLAEWRYTTDER